MTGLRYSMRATYPHGDTILILFRLFSHCYNFISSSPGSVPLQNVQIQWLHHRNRDTQHCHVTTGFPRVEQALSWCKLIFRAVILKPGTNIPCQSRVEVCPWTILIKLTGQVFICEACKLVSPGENITTCAVCRNSVAHSQCVIYGEEGWPQQAINKWKWSNWDPRPLASRGR